MKYLFLSTFRFFEPEIEAGSSIEIMPGISITKSVALKRKLLTKEFKRMAGEIEFSHIKNATSIIYAEDKNGIFASKSSGSEKALLVWMLWLDMIIYSSWLVKDNSMLCEIGYCNKVSSTESSWSNNSLQVFFSTAEGLRFEKTSFSISELEDWRDKNHKLQEHLYNNNSTMTDSFISSDYSRYGRAYSFIKSARVTIDPAMKIAHYCSALESLFSTDNSELTYKLSERVSLFMKDFGYDPMDVFSDMKRYYAIRSAVTHGDSIKGKKLDTIPKASRELDDYLRVIMNRIISSDELMDLFNGDKSGVNDYFLRKILLD
ncbi:hypothetical protein [Tatumella terrea]|uniref:Apea-like HEPN domain-containing protein n=1 Tax=Tatumella terrea TaxID=419007 RepID=A0ABW1W570_9GAMM